MHVGKTAYSGHYTAQIKNFQSNEWNNFNDEVITKIKKKQQLGCTDDEVESAGKNPEDSKKTKMPQLHPNTRQRLSQPQTPIYLFIIALIYSKKCKRMNQWN